jgi:hypothetical protein
MEKKLANDILRAIQKSTNLFVAHCSNKHQGDRFFLRHPSGKSIAVMALAPLNGSCFIFESGGEWFAYSSQGIEQEVSSTTVINRRRKNRDRFSVLHEPAYLFEEVVDDGVGYPFVNTVYQLDREAKIKRCPSIINRSEPFFSTEQAAIAHYTLPSGGGNYSNTSGGDVGAHPLYESYPDLLRSPQDYAYSGSNGINLPIDDNDSYYVLAFASHQAALFYTADLPQLDSYPPQTMVVGVAYNLATQLATGGLSSLNLARFNSAGSSLAASFSCSHASFTPFFNPPGLNLLTRGVSPEFAYTFWSAGTGSISGSALKNSSLQASYSVTGSAPASVNFFVRAENYGPFLFSYEGMIMIPAVDSSPTLIKAIAFRPLKIDRNLGKKTIYLQRRDESPIKLYTMAKDEYCLTKVSSKDEDIEVLLQLSLRQEAGYPHNPLGLRRVVIIKVNANSNIPQISTYDYPTSIPIPNNWLKLFYSYDSPDQVARTAQYNLNNPDNLNLVQTFPYWSTLPWTNLYAQYPNTFDEYIFNFTNIFAKEDGTLIYVEVADLRDTNPLLPTALPIELLLGYLPAQGTYNNRLILSALLTGRFATPRVWAVRKIGGQYTTPIAQRVKLFPLKINVNPATDTLASIQDKISRHNLLAIIPYRAKRVRASIVNQKITFPVIGDLGSID